MIHEGVPLLGIMVLHLLDEDALQEDMAGQMEEEREIWMYTDQDRCQDRDHQDATEVALDRTHQDRGHHQEDAMEDEEAGEEIVLVDEMEIAEDEAQVTVATAVMMTEAAVEAVGEAEEADDKSKLMTNSKLLFGSSSSFSGGVGVKKVDIKIKNFCRYEGTQSAPCMYRSQCQDLFFSCCMRNGRPVAAAMCTI